MNKINKKEVLFILSIIIVAIIAMLFISTKSSSKNVKALLQISGQTVETFTLDDYNEKTIISLEQYGITGKIEINNHKIRFINIDCPDHICEKTGYIYKENQSAICIPNKMSLSIIK